MSLSKADVTILKATIARLKGESSTSREIDVALRDEHVRPWLDTWVVDALQCVLDANDRTISGFKRSTAREIGLGLSRYVAKDSEYGRIVAGLGAGKA